MRIGSLHLQVDLISSLILEKNVKNVDSPIQIYSIALKSGAIQYAAVKNHDAFPASLSNGIDALSSFITYL